MDHAFIKVHDLGELGFKRFDSDPNIVLAWQRLVDNTFCSADITFLQHEYTEALIMDIMRLDQQAAHSIANKYFNWDKLLER